MQLLHLRQQLLYLLKETLMQAPPFTLTNESITVVWEGTTHTVQKGQPQFLALKKAIQNEDWKDIPNHLTVAKSLNEWAKGKFTYQNGQFRYNGEPLPGDLGDRAVAMATSGQDPTPLFNFWEKLQKNPSKRSVDQLWGFMEHDGHPLQKNGNFLAYKSVKGDYKDCHSGKFDNSPGAVNEMPRNQISDDPREACHEGFHVGSERYAKGFSGSRIVICEVDPADVVCVPYDSSQGKMRVCKYKVIGNHNGETLPSTVFIPDADEAPDVNDELEKKETKPSSKATPFDKMDMHELMSQSIDALRKYAGKTVKIVGASKIPGGKTALVKKIMAVRKKMK